MRMELFARSTSAEKAACMNLDKMGIAYVRQHWIRTLRRNYFADIYIPALRLVLEIDGRYHDTVGQKRLDGNRSANLRKLGYHVCRLKNREAYSFEAVKRKIRRYE